jgi:hypothetical protein
MKCNRLSASVSSLAGQPDISSVMNAQRSNGGDGYSVSICGR